MIEAEATGGPHKHSCVMLYFPDKLAAKIQAWGEKNIDEDWLTGDGREAETHVTVLYGIVSKERADAEPFFPKGPVTVQLGKVSRFDTSPDFDVIKIEVEGDELHEIHEAMKDGLENKDEHPEYKPHVTLAYVAKGKGRQLDGARPFDGIDVELTDLVWSPAGADTEGKEHVDLAGEKVASSWLWTPWMRR